VSTLTNRRIRRQRSASRTDVSRGCGIQYGMVQGGGCCAGLAGVQSLHVSFMPLSTGTRLGQYEILTPIGTGGMGEVYRARDTKLGREVAIKVLPEAFAHDTERLTRFDREARVLASLNHPKIAAIYGLEQSGDGPFLVMELALGKTLAEQLASGPLDIDEAMRLSAQIAEALEAAHQKGIIHRDLKPANINVTPEGNVKVLDFGLAKALADDPPHADPSQSPTVTAATRAGMILGTASYMSPEQARGRPLDSRTDIWPFGCVLYELLTGRSAFGAENVSDTLVAILKQEPDWNRLPGATPASMRILLGEGPTPASARHWRRAHRNRRSE
jgi:serine/threonine protein kinase